MRHLIENLETLVEGFKVTLAAKKTINAFLDKEKGECKKLVTDGKRLDGKWMGGRGIAEWSGGKIVFTDLGSKAAQTVQNAVRKAAPKNWLAEDVLLELKMLTKADLAKLPPLYSQDDVKDPIVWVKFFYPYGRGTWLATEFDGKDTFFGYVMGLGFDELGYFSLRELTRNKVEREKYWKPMTLSKAKAYEKRISGRM